MPNIIYYSEHSTRWGHWVGQIGEKMGARPKRSFKLLPGISRRAESLPSIGVRHVEILLSQILPKHSVESLQITLRYPTGLGKSPPTLTDDWIASGRDFPEVDVKGEVSRLLDPDLGSKVAVLSFHDCCLLTNPHCERGHQNLALSPDPAKSPPECHACIVYNPCVPNTASYSDHRFLSYASVLLSLRSTGSIMGAPWKAPTRICTTLNSRKFPF